MALTKISRSLLDTGISDSSDATAITIDSSENVGIGITSPKTNLDIASATGAVLTLTDTRTVATTGDLLGKINFYNSDASGDGAQNAAAIAAFHNGSIGNGGIITFSTTTGSSGSEGAEPTERVRILADGKVGIGKTDPNYPLVVAGTNPKVQIYDSDGNGQTNLYFGDSGSNLAGYVIYQHSDNVMRFGTDAAERMRINDDGNTMFGTTSEAYTSARLHVGNGNATYAWAFGTIANYSPFYIINSAGTGVYLANNQNTWTSSSDETLKENIEDIGNVLDIVKNYRTVKFNFIGQEEEKIGFIAQDWQNNFPQVISVDEKNNKLGIQYTETIPVLLKAIQEQQAQIEALQSEINTLKGE